MAHESAMICDPATDAAARADRDRFFTLSADMLTVAGFDGYFRRVNPAFERILGYTRDELISRPWLEFVHPDDRDATVAEGRKVRQGTTTLHFDNRYRCKDGSYRWLSWSAVPVMAEGLIYAVARDIAERKEMEQRLSEKNRQLEEAARAERSAHEALKLAQSRLVETEKLAALGQLVAGVAHEINNPLSFVTNNLAVLQRDLRYVVELIRLYRSGDHVLEQSAPELYRQINDFAESIDLAYTLSELEELTPVLREGLSRIRHIVKDLREFARHDDVGDVQEGADMNAGIESTVNIARGRVRNQGVQIELDLAPLPPVTAQPAKINQVVLNLLVNAIDACGDTGGMVTVRSRAVPGGVEFEVADTGSGIPAAVRDRIFDPFFTTKPQGQGTGMGLSISHGIVSDHGGSIDVETAVGRGSTFTVRLPLAPPRKKKEAEPSSRGAAPPNEGFSRTGFSLIELLVTIGIITVLISILLPWLTKFRQAGRAVMCQSHQRQLVMGFLAFANDHDGCLPGNYWDSIHQQPTDAYKRDWLLGDNPNQGNAALQVLDGPQKGTVFPYINDPRVYLCPAHQTGFLNAGAGSNGRFDYAAILCLSGAKVINVEPFGEFHYSTSPFAGTTVSVSTPLVVEEEPSGGINGGNVEGGHCASDRLGHCHNGGGYYASIDGSVHWFLEPLQQNSTSWSSQAPSGANKGLGPVPSPSWGYWNSQ